jgi:tRNA modification GTPase
MDGISAEEAMKQLTQMLTIIPEKTIIILNKADLTLKEVGASDNMVLTVRVSAKTGRGLDVLKKTMLQLIGLNEENEGAFIARKRHVTALKKSLAHAKEASVQLEQYKAGELAAEELKISHQFLGSIVGFISSDDLLGEIFSSFCIGK